jgi:hypothetical protein
MKKNAIYFCLSILILLYGCAATTVQQTIYLGDVKVDAPITPPPTHVTIDKKAGDITVSPKFIINTQQHIDSNVNDRYEEAVLLPDNTSYKTPGHNLDWKFPSIVAGVDIDVAATNNFSVFGGIHFSNTSDQDLIGGNFGIGFYSSSKNPAARFDIGLSFQNYQYDAVTIVQTKVTREGKTNESWFLFHDRGNTTNFNPFLSLTINSVNEETPLNYFISLNYFTQKLLSFEPRQQYMDYSLWGTSVYTTDLRSETTCGFVAISPGLTYEFTDKMRFVGSIKILKEVLALKNYNSWIIMPSVQMDFHF